jgi:hypothetical protein
VFWTLDDRAGHPGRSLFGWQIAVVDDYKQGGVRPRATRIQQLVALAPLPDVPMSWHFHHVFELTIRHSASNRFATAEDAIGCAKEIRRLITGGCTPLEQLADMLCPQCGLGRFDGTKAAMASFEPLFQQFREKMEPFRGFVAICPVCFHISFAAKEALQNVLADRMKLA